MCYNNFIKSKEVILIRNLFCSVLRIVFTLAVYASMAIVLSIPVMLLWNWLVPTIFGLTSITLVQAWGISFLCGLLFGRNVNESND